MSSMRNLAIATTAAALSTLAVPASATPFTDAVCVSSASDAGAQIKATNGSAVVYVQRGHCSNETMGGQITKFEPLGMNCRSPWGYIYRDGLWYAWSVSAEGKLTLTCLKSVSA